LPYQFLKPANVHRFEASTGGFGTVTPSQFMKAKTMEDVFALLDQKKPHSN
jgi:hypothetical protein